MHIHLWEISSVDKMNTYCFFRVFFSFPVFPTLLRAKYLYLEDYFCRGRRLYCLRIKQCLSFISANKERRCSRTCLMYTSRFRLLASFPSRENCAKGVDTSSNNLWLIITLIWELKLAANCYCSKVPNANSLR